MVCLYTAGHSLHTCTQYGYVVVHQSQSIFCGIDSACRSMHMWENHSPATQRNLSALFTEETQPLLNPLLCVQSSQSCNESQTATNYDKLRYVPSWVQIPAAIAALLWIVMNTTSWKSHEFHNSLYSEWCMTRCIHWMSGSTVQKTACRVNYTAGHWTCSVGLSGSWYFKNAYLG